MTWLRYKWFLIDWGLYLLSEVKHASLKSCRILYFCRQKTSSWGLASAQNSKGNSTRFAWWFFLLLGVYYVVPKKYCSFGCLKTSLLIIEIMIKICKASNMYCYNQRDISTNKSNFSAKINLWLTLIQTSSINISTGIRNACNSLPNPNNFTTFASQ